MTHPAQNYGDLASGSIDIDGRGDRNAIDRRRHLDAACQHAAAQVVGAVGIEQADAVLGDVCCRRRFWPGQGHDRVGDNLGQEAERRGDRTRLAQDKAVGRRAEAQGHRKQVTAGAGV